MKEESFQAALRIRENGDSIAAIKFLLSRFSDDYDYEEYVASTSLQKLKAIKKINETAGRGKSQAISAICEPERPEEIQKILALRKDL